jgi:hypothetical protein
MTASKPAPPKPAGPGPKPGGPTHPTPTGPGPQLAFTNPTHPPPRPLPNPNPPPRPSGHLPISDPRAGGARDGAGVGPISLGRLIAAIRVEVARAFGMTGYQWDPASGPQQEDAPIGPDWVQIQLAEVRVDLRAALTALDELRRVTTMCHLDRHPGEGRTSGLAVVAAPVATSVEAFAGGHTRGAGADLHDPERPTYPKPSPGFALPQPPPFDMARPPVTHPRPSTPGPPTRPNQPRPIR